MKNFNNRIEVLRKEITGAIRTLLKENGLVEMEIPDTVDSIYVICFSEDTEPHECVVKIVSMGFTEIIIEACDKHTGEMFVISEPHTMGLRDMYALNSIYLTMQELISNNKGHKQ